MKRTLSYTAGIIGLAIGLITSTAFAQTTANGPYYATPSWDQTLPGATRFIVLANMDSQAVLDRETGLVWERTPTNSSLTWAIASQICLGSSKGGRLGWRLPTIQELASLVDPTRFPGLPLGHPFLDVQSAIQQIDTNFYWSSTTYLLIPTSVWGASFGTLLNSRNFQIEPIGKPAQHLTWCVRSGSGVDTQ